jgi:transposase
MKRYHGIDLHASRLVMHRIIPSEAGIQRRTETMITDKLEETLFPFFGPTDVVCVEASTCTAWFVRELRKTGAKVTVINPFDFKALYVMSKKTDKIDAKKLAEYVYHQDQLASECLEAVHVPEREVGQMRKAISLYKFVTKNIVACQNQVLGIFRAKCLSFGYAQYRANRENYLRHRRMDDFDRQRIEELEELIRRYTEQKESLRETICRLGVQVKGPEIRILITVPGISVFAGACIMADIDDIRRFKTAKRLCSYLSSTPKIDASNTSIRIKGLNKHGRKVAFNAVLQSLNHIIDSNSLFRRFSEKKTQGKAACKVRTAIVRRTMTTLFYMLKNNEAYRFCNMTIYARKVKEFEKFSQAA